jgi:uncharacterized protein (TIRG00374 family)
VDSDKNFKLNKIFNRLVIIISIGILAHLIFLLYTTDKEILSHLKQLKFSYILLILGLIMVPWLGHSVRMVLWTTFLKVPLKFKECFRIAVTTDLGSSITPTLIGGGPIKLGMLMKKKISAGKAGTLTLLGGFEDFIMYLGAFITACFFLKDTIVSVFVNLYQTAKENILYVSILFFLFLVFRWFLKNYYSKTLASLIPEKVSRLWRKITVSLTRGFQEMKEAFMLILKRGKLRFILSFSILLIQWTAKFSILLVILTALKLPFNAPQMYLQQWLVYLSMIFIPTPGATGGAEASFYFIFNGEVDKKFLPLIVSVWRFFTYYMILFSAVVMVQLFSVYDLHFRKKT